MLTEQEVDDPSQVGPLREQIPQEIEQITADGAYDGEPTCETIARRDPDIAVVIPPRVTGLVSAAFDAKPSPRDTHLLMIESLGRLGWQEISGYARRRWWRPRWDATSPLSGREFVRATGADRRLKQRSASPFSTACLRLVGRTPSAPRVALLEIVGEGVTSIYAASLHQRSTRPFKRVQHALLPLLTESTSSQQSWPPPHRTSWFSHSPHSMRFVR